MKNEKKGKKLEKKVIVDFDKIDITTATEEEIIESGIKKNTKKDKNMYLLMVLIFILMILPPLLRLFLPKPILFIDRDVVYLKQRCFTSAFRHNSTWRFDASYIGDYRDGKLETVTLEYKYQKNTQNAQENVTFPEIEELNAIDNPGIVKSKIQEKEEDKEINGVKFIIDYKNHQESLIAIPEVKKFSYGNSTMVMYFKDLGYMCSQAEIVNKMETVKVDE